MRGMLSKLCRMNRITPRNAKLVEMTHVCSDITERKLLDEPMSTKNKPLAVKNNFSTRHSFLEKRETFFFFYILIRISFPRAWEVEITKRKELR